MNLMIKMYNDKEKGKLPERAHPTDAGFDVRYPGETPIQVTPRQTVLIDLHIAFEVPVGTICQLMSRSSLAKKGIEVKGGTIDAGYTGNIGVLIYNNSEEPYQIEPNERVAQAVFLQLAEVSGIQLVNTREELGKVYRGDRGFGSTGKDEMEAYFPSSSRVFTNCIPETSASCKKMA